MIGTLLRIVLCTSVNLKVISNLIVRMIESLIDMRSNPALVLNNLGEDGKSRNL